MRLLLDTHVMLWWLRDDARLGARTRHAIRDPSAIVMVSIASFWELSIKTRSGKITESGALLMDEVTEQGMQILHVQRHHLFSLERLERIPGHNDPFDHLILAQARAERAALLTADRQLLAYGAQDLSVS